MAIKRQDEKMVRGWMDGWRHNEWTGGCCVAYEVWVGVM